MPQKPVAKFEVKSMAEGQHQVLCLWRCAAHQFSRVARNHAGNALWNNRKPALIRVEPRKLHTRQGPQHLDDGAPDMARAPDPDLPFCFRNRLDEPALHDARRGNMALTACPGQRPMHGKRHLGGFAGKGPRGDGAIKPTQSGLVPDFGQKRHRAAAALVQRRAKRHPFEPCRYASGKLLAGGLGRLKFKRATADGAGLAILPDDHRRTRLTRGRALSFGHDNAHDLVTPRKAAPQFFAVEAHGTSPRARATAARTASAVAGA
jgi:hypothetical protein